MNSVCFTSVLYTRMYNNACESQLKKLVLYAKENKPISLNIMNP